MFQRKIWSLPSGCLSIDSRLFLEIHQPSNGHLQLLFSRNYFEGSVHKREGWEFKRPPNATDLSARLPAWSVSLGVEPLFLAQALEVSVEKQTGRGGWGGGVCVPCLDEARTKVLGRQAGSLQSEFTCLPR